MHPAVKSACDQLQSIGESFRVIGEHLSESRGRAEVRTFAERTDHDATATTTLDPETSQPVTALGSWEEIARERFGEVSRLYGYGQFAVIGTTADGEQLAALFPERFDAEANAKYWTERGLRDVRSEDLGQPAPVGSGREPQLVDPDQLRAPSLNVQPAVFSERRRGGVALSPERRRAILASNPLGRQVLEREAERQRGE
jgi:hypothetical protein